MENVHAIEFKNITKRFGSVVANNHVDLYVDHGVVMAILGENGSGKTSLMNMVAGIYYPDEGEIFVEGKKVTIKTPKDAFAVGVGMIHQHFKLIDVFTAAQNVILGLEEEKMDLKAVSKKVKEIADKYSGQISLTSTHTLDDIDNLDDLIADDIDLDDIDIDGFDLTDDFDLEDL